MRRSYGFTLIELLVTITLAIILCSFAFSSFTSLLKRLEARNVAYGLQALVSASRNHALQLHQAITICGSSDTLHCDNNWSRGVLLMVDGNRNGVLEGNDRILQFVEFNLDQAKLTWRGFSGNRVTIESFGTSFASNGTFTYCRTDDDPIYRRQVIINRSGRARVSHDTNGDGIDEDSNGNPISCP